MSRIRTLTSPLSGKPIVFTGTGLNVAIDLFNVVAHLAALNPPS